MSEAWTDGWRELCLQALCELERERSMAVLDKLRRPLRKETHNFGPLWVDLANAEVKRNGNLVSLRNLEFRLLRYLIERADSLVSREELFRSVWSYDSRASTRTVDVHICSLRHKLEMDASRPALIVTVQGSGYKFVARQRIGSRRSTRRHGRHDGRGREQPRGDVVPAPSDWGGRLGNSYRGIEGPLRSAISLEVPCSSRMPPPEMK